MTWVYKTKRELFPTEKIISGKDIEDIYKIKGRQYDIRNIAEGNNVVMVEMI